MEILNKNHFNKVYNLKINFKPLKLITQILIIFLLKKIITLHKILIKNLILTKMIIINLIILFNQIKKLKQQFLIISKINNIISNKTNKINKINNKIINKIINKTINKTINKIINKTNNKTINKTKIIKIKNLLDFKMQVNNIIKNKNRLKIINK